MPEESGEPTFDLVITPVSDKFAADDDRWLDQVSTFYRELDTEVGGIRRETKPVENSKGGIEAVILALGSAGAFTAGVEFFRAWLGRDRSRSLTVSWTDNGKPETVTVSGDNIDQDGLHLVAAAAAARIGGAAWQGQATKPS